MKIVEFAFVVYPATDLVRSRAFYGGVLGFNNATSMNLVDGFWVEYEIGPHTLAIGKEPFLKPSGDGPQLVLEVDDFDKTIDISDITTCSSLLSLLTFLTAGQRLSWTPTVTNSAFINETPNQRATACRRFHFFF